LPQFEGHGYAREASGAVLNHARTDLGLRRIVAITLPENERSIGLLKRLGLQESGLKEVGGEQLLLMAIEFDGGTK
jgi:RimJ/RimL family protein N-acetyltransferase